MAIKGTIIIDKVIIITDLLITNLQITSIGRVMVIIIITSLEECITLMPAEGEAGDHITRVDEVSLITITIKATVTERNENQVIDQTGVIAVKITGQPVETPVSYTHLTLYILKHLNTVCNFTYSQLCLNNVAKNMLCRSMFINFYPELII